MGVEIREYNNHDISAMVDIWNQVVREGKVFPQVEVLDVNEAACFFAQQTRSAALVADSLA